MNLPIVLMGLAGAYLILNKKKPTSSKVKEETPKEELPQDQIEKPKEEKKNEIQLPENPIYSELTKGRIGLIESFLKDLPLKVNPQITPEVYIPLNPKVLDYSEWITANPKGLYQGWLATMIYWTIAIREGKWDAGDVEHRGELPLIFKCAEKFDVATTDPLTFKIVVFPETPDQCNLRLAKGQKLWLEINEYIMNNLKACPEGAYCGPLKQI